MGIVLDGIEDHEGYLGLVLDDGTVTSSYSRGIKPRIRAVMPRCECGWSGTLIPHKPGYPDDDEYDALMREWRDNHAGGLVVDRRLREAAEAARRAKVELREAVAVARAAGRPWSEVGAALGVTKQGAQQRFG